MEIKKENTICPDFRFKWGGGGGCRHSSTTHAPAFYDNYKLLNIIAIFVRIAKIFSFFVTQEKHWTLDDKFMHCKIY